MDDKPHVESEKEVLGKKGKHEPQQETQEDQDEDGKQDEGHAKVCKCLGSLQHVWVGHGLRHEVENMVKWRESNV